MNCYTKEHNVYPEKKKLIKRGDYKETVRVQRWISDVSNSTIDPEGVPKTGKKKKVINLKGE